MQIPKGTKVTTDGRFYFFHINYDAIKFMLGEADQVKYLLFIFKYTNVRNLTTCRSLIRLFKTSLIGQMANDKHWRNNFSIFIYIYLLF